ncbi:MAG: NYN domain-containing protein [Endomicrobiales bacterium]
MTATPPYVLPRFKVFIDYWNFQLMVNGAKGDPRVRIDWRIVGQFLAKQASLKTGDTTYSYEGTNIYTSYNPKTETKTYLNWVNTFLKVQPGVQVDCSERRTKMPPKCPDCHKEISSCPNCGGKMFGTVEKGVDARIVTDMIRLAWENAYDVAVLVSSDRDLIPGVEFLDAKGKKVIHAGFPPIGSELSQSCWGSFSVIPLIDQIIRP